eukprot:11338454-Alexandrium_andersonii.AAC.1
MMVEILKEASRLRTGQAALMRGSRKLVGPPPAQNGGEEEWQCIREAQAMIPGPHSDDLPGEG